MSEHLHPLLVSKHRTDVDLLLEREHSSETAAVRCAFSHGGRSGHGS